MNSLMAAISLLDLSAFRCFLARCSSVPLAALRELILLVSFLIS